jgi:hypothetical protein
MQRSDLLGNEVEREHGLPYPWQVGFDEDVQSYYYYNPETGETEWASGQEPSSASNGADYLEELDSNGSVANASRTSSLSVVDRSNQMLASKKERETALRQQLSRQQQAEMRDAPQINARSRRLNRNVEDMFAWEEHRRQKMDALAQKRMEEESAHNTGRPKLYPTSNASVVSTGSGGSGGLPVEERLLAYEEKRRLKLQAARAQGVHEANRSAIPTISPHSANLARRRASGGYDGGGRVQLNAEDVPGIIRDHATGQMLFQVKHVLAISK